MPVEQRAAGNGDGMERPKQLKPALMPDDCEAAERAKQAGERRARRAWCEAEVWTNWMLVALKQGVNGGKWSRVTKHPWPNAFLKKHGLLSLLEYRAEYCQSLRGTR